MSSFRHVTGITFSLLLAPFPSLGGQGWIEPDRIPQPRTAIEKVRASVQVTVSGRVARVTVEEWFRNAGSMVDEGTYHYPLPGEAVFSQFSLWQGETELRGEMMDARQARAIYESIVRRRKDPALIELVDHGLIRARVFPINPGETRKITLRYTQVLDRVGDAFRLRFAGGRDTIPRTFHLTAEGAASLGEPFSPTHGITTRRVQDRLEVRIAEGRWRGDVELFLPLAGKLVGLSLLTHRPVGEEGFFMLLLAPGRGAERDALPRDVVAVLDISGSMSGEKILQARAALEQLIGSLRSGDRFRLVAFSSGVRRFAPDWTEATPDARHRAAEWVRELQAGGGTNIAAALEEALLRPPREAALGVVVFLTDGLPSVGEQDPERLAARAEHGRGRFRVFAFGIGHDVNTYLLDRLTERARGTTQYIAPEGDIEQAVAALATKLSSPVLGDLAIRVDGDVEVYDLQPATLPDLFAGDELVVFGRYRGTAGGEREVTVTGRRAGREERFATAAVFGAEQPANDYLAPLWAARKAGALAREIRLRGMNREILEELKQLALRYGILTEYTAYLVQEPDQVVLRQREEQVLRRDAAPAPEAAVGAGAVGRSRRDAFFSEAARLEAVTVAAQAVADSLATETASVRGGSSPMRRAGGRLFALRDGAWTDTRHGDSLRTVAVEAYSPAYVALLKALPELVEPARLGETVVVAGRRLSLKLAARGLTVWPAGELERVVRGFRS
ncbi:MAG TPA: VIT domain-containing protein [Gemmatimonadales bacterium]|nr:VIT domain-containing protein [Gemmatimonadales bacterium]